MAKYNGLKSRRKAVKGAAATAVKAHNKAQNDQRQEEAWYQRNGWKYYPGNATHMPPEGWDKGPPPFTASVRTRLGQELQPDEGEPKP